MRGVHAEDARETVSAYQRQHADDTEAGRQARLESYTRLVNRYYDLVTDFYEFGWGQSFHFAVRETGEPMAEAIIRHERHLIKALNPAPSHKLIDIGCGVGGPMRQFARDAGCEVVGINNNAYQIERGWKHCRKQGLGDKCSFVRADFMALPYRDGTFDGAYTIEASCHAPDRVALFSEIRRVLRPGSRFVGYEWCLTDVYDDNNAEHRRVRKDIEIGNGLPDMVFCSDIDDALKEAGFKVVEAYDRSTEGTVPWYASLSGHDRSLRSLPRTPVGRSLTNVATRVLETVRLAPKGTREVSDFLNAGADALVAGGAGGFFTPMYYFCAEA